MKKNNIISLVAILVFSCVACTSSALAAWVSQPTINVEGLTLDEAQEKYGFASGSNNPLIFEVNAQLGAQSCGLVTAAGCSQACPAAKIFYQSNKVVKNSNGSSTMKVDIYYDVNEVDLSDVAACKV